MPITSHDSGSPAQEFGSAGSTIPRYVAAALLGTGATGIPQGVEWAEEQRINFIGRQPRISLPAEPKFAGFIVKVNAILADNPAFRCGENCRFVDNNHPAVIAAFRAAAGTQHLGFLVVCNFDIQNPQRITIDLAGSLAAAGPFTCTDLLTGQPRTFPTADLNLQLPPCSAQVLQFPRTK
jgi:hypothetical protein